jgi:acyl carrier protein
MTENNSVSQVATPSRDRVAEEVIEIIAKFFHRSRDTILESNDLFNDLGVDSLDDLEILMEIEEHFDIAVPDEIAENTHTVGEIIEMVHRLLRNTRNLAN